MSSRSNFVKGELEKIYSNLNMSFTFTDHCRLENDNKFIKVFEMLMEIKEKSIILNSMIKDNYLFI